MTGSPNGPTHEELALWRRETRLLTTAVEDLSEKIGDVATRSEIFVEINRRVVLIETGLAGALSRDRRAIIRARTAAVVFLVSLMFATILVSMQVREFQDHSCTAPIASKAVAAVCQVSYPTHSFVTTTGGYDNPAAVIAGVLLYILAFAGLAWTYRRYRSRKGSELKRYRKDV